MVRKIAKEISLNNVKIEDGFWSQIQKTVIDTVIPYQEKILKDQVSGAAKSHAIANFRIAAGLEGGEFYGMVFQDSDVAKWLEAVAYSLAINPDEELERRADDIIEIIGKAQQEDGYLNTYFTIKEPDRRWENLHECHELYCAGHMMEAAVAYYQATGKDKLLHIMERMADHIGNRFGPDKEKGIPGHQEIEIGLMRLYHATGKEKYRDLAQFFVDERGKNPNYFAEEKKKRGWSHFGLDPKDTKYSQCHLPVREQKKAEGHSVRAVYMYTAMADLAAEIKDQSLYDACVRLWNNMVNKRMYITGAIGSTPAGEGFTIDYDLPNDTGYGETCASIGLIFFAKQMLDINPSNYYGDIMERALYNGVISGMGLDGQHFFYVNPLEVNPGISGELFGYRHVLPQRPKWHACACCPPNLARLLTSLGKYAWSEGEDTIYSHLFIGGELSLEKADIKIETNYPWEGRIVYKVSGKVKDEFQIAIRIPAWAKNTSIRLNGEEIRLSSSIKDGYAYIKKGWDKNGVIEVTFDMPVRRIYSNTKVGANAGCVALMRGPLVYCFEGIDNGDELQSLRIPRKGQIRILPYDRDLLKGIVPIEVEGIKLIGEGSLYSEIPPEEKPVILKAIPYYAWGNRGLNQMRVWMLEKW